MSETNDPPIDDLPDRVREIVASRLEGQQAGHGMDHIMRVYRTACQIQSETGGERLIVQLAALLHDVGDAKFNDGQERSAEFSRQILSDCGVTTNLIDHVAEIVDNISFRKGVDPTTLSLEGKIVQDADRIDALGAIGIVRTIEYGATTGQPFHVSGASSHADTGIGHFYEKLFKLHDLLNTEAAKRIAGRREQFMRDFVDQYLSEIG
jgi:uncharacterized protein